MSAVTLACCICFIVHKMGFQRAAQRDGNRRQPGDKCAQAHDRQYVLCCFLSAVIVSYVGLISFIGLIAPHIVRRVVGNNHVYLIPGSILAGSSLLLLGDLFARTVISPVVLPIGAITSFLGGPLFLYLLFKGRDRGC